MSLLIRFYTNIFIHVDNRMKEDRTGQDRGAMSFNSDHKLSLIILFEFGGTRGVLRVGWTRNCR